MGLPGKIQTIGSGKPRHAVGPPGPQRVAKRPPVLVTPEAPRSGPRRAPGGPPEGQSKKEQEMVCNVTFVDF